MSLAFQPLQSIRLFFRHPQRDLHDRLAKGEIQIYLIQVFSSIALNTLLPRRLIINK